MTTAINSSTPTVQELGLGSSLDVTSIVNALMKTAQLPQQQLANEVTNDQTQVSAYGQLSSILSSFQASLTSLTSASVFQTLQASVANSSVASATVAVTSGSGAPTAGIHTLSVSQLAANQVVASSDFSDPTATVGTGTITIQYGTWNAGNTSFTPNANQAASTITIGSGNSSVTGVVQAINASNSGVTASIINDGTGSRLVLSNNNTGAANGFKISVSDSDGNNTDASGLSALAYDPTVSGGTPQTTLLRSSQDAQFNVDGIAITNASNTVTNAIQGLTLNLLQTTTSPTTLTVAQSTSAASNAIQNLVSAYNAVQSTVSGLASFNASTGSAGPLNGDSSVRMITGNLQNILASVFTTSAPNIQTVADLGIAFQEDGSITLNTTTLNNALNANPAAVGQLFSTAATSTDSLVSYQTSTGSTQPGSYPLTISQLATHGTLAGSQAAGLTITQGVNDALNLVIDDVAATVTLNPGTYTSASLASALQSAINTNSTFAQAKIQASVTQSGGTLTIAAGDYGSNSSVAITGGDGAANLLGASPAAAAGLDVAGTLGGVAFTGNGQVATGAANTPVAGLALTIAGGSTGARGTVDFSQGIAAQLNTALTSYLDPTNGIIASATAGITATITNLQNQEQQMVVNLAAMQANLEAQFSAMDLLVASLNSTSSFLTQQLSGGSSSSSGSSNSSTATSGTVSTN